MTRILLVEIGYLNAGVPGTLRYCSGGIGYTTRPSDTPANETYAPKLERLTFRYDYSEDPLRVGSGEIGIKTLGTDRDAILDYVYDNQTVIVLEGQHDAAYSTFNEIARWALEQPEDTDPTIVTIRTHSQTYGLDRPLQTERYGGTGGLDGGSELANKPKPFASGPIVSAKAVLVDAVKNIWQLSSTHEVGPLWAAQGLTAQADQDATAVVVYDEGVPITQGAAYASVAQMNSTAPTGPDGCRVCNAFASGAANNYGIYVRLQSTPIGEVTFSMVSRAIMIGNATLYAIFTLIYSASGLNAQIPVPDGSAIIATFPYHVSLFFGSDGEPATYMDALRAIMKGMRGWILPYAATPTQLGGGIRVPWTARWLDTPATAAASPYINYLLDPLGLVTPYLTINGARIAEGSFKRVAQYDFGWPEFRTTLLYDRVWYLQTTGLAGGVTPAQRARLALEYLSTSDEDLSVQTSYPTAVDRTVPTAWSSAVGTIANEAARQFAVFQALHPTFQLKARADFYHAALTVPGDKMTVEDHPRFGCDVSRDFQILGIGVDYLAYDQRAGTVSVDLTLMG